jgi:large subunit ribosomal protein L1
MDKDQFEATLKQVRKISPKRKFSQSVDLIINLKGINLKKPEEQIDLFVTLHYPRGKKVKVCALVGPELAEQAKKVCDHTIRASDFDKIGADKKALRKLSNTYDYFIAQANIMPQVAKAFGRVFGPKGKMPNPKAGCVVPPSANLQPLYDKLQKTVRAVAKTQPCIQCLVGNESMKDEEIIDSILTVFNQVVHHLPAEKNNIKNVFMKLTMGKCVKVKKDHSPAEEKPKEETKEVKKEEKAEKAPKDTKEEKKPKKAKAKKEEATPKKEETAETKVSDNEEKKVEG